MVNFAPEWLQEVKADALRKLAWELSVWNENELAFLCYKEVGLQLWELLQKKIV